MPGPGGSAHDPGDLERDNAFPFDLKGKLRLEECFKDCESSEEEVELTLELGASKLQTSSWVFGP